MVLDQEDPIGKSKEKNVLPGSLTTVGMVVLLERLRVRMDRGIWKKLLPTAPCPYGQMLPKSQLGNSKYLIIFFFSHCCILLSYPRVSLSSLLCLAREDYLSSRNSPQHPWEMATPARTQRLHFPDSFAVSCGHVMEF